MTRTITSVVAALVCAALMLGSSSTAQDLNPLEKTLLTFDRPVEVPGTTLQPGTYTFMLADTPGRNVVQVWDQTAERMIAQWLFMQTTRAEATSDPVVMFKESASGQTQALQSWFYPGERIGKEFVYPREQAVRIAARTDQRVLSTDGPIESNAEVSAVDRAGTLTPVPAPPAAASQQAGAQPQPAPAQPPAAARPEPAPQPAPQVNTQPPAEPTTTLARQDTLPQTASPMAYVALAGLLSLAGAAVVGRVARR